MLNFGMSSLATWGHEEMAQRIFLGDAPCSYISEGDAVLSKGGGTEHFAQKITSAMDCIRWNATPSQVREFNISYVGGAFGFKMKSETPTVSDALRAKREQQQPANTHASQDGLPLDNGCRRLGEIVAEAA